MPGILKFKILPRPPFRLDLTCWALRRRPENELDQWDGQSYSRLIRLRGRLHEMRVNQSGAPSRPLLDITLSGLPAAPDELAATRRLAVDRVKTILGTGIDLSGFYSYANGHKTLKHIVLEFSGFKPPRFESVYEAVVNGICCQQLSLTVGITLLNRLAVFSQGFKGRRGLPRPEDLARLEPDDLRPFGFSRNKATALISVSRDVAGGKLDLESLGKYADEEAIERLIALRGVGRWTAEYVLLRGLGRLSVFPGGDAGARRNFNTFLSRRGTLDYDGMKKELSSFHPYEGLIYFHLLLKGLSARGFL